METSGSERFVDDDIIRTWVPETTNAVLAYTQGIQKQKQVVLIISVFDTVNRCENGTCTSRKKLLKLDKVQRRVTRLI